MISIISGKYRGKKLNQINRFVRPTQARVRKSIFEILGPFDNKTVLDLFSGVGTLAIESLSRGAVHVTCIESNSSVFKILVRNMKEICSDDNIELYRLDVLKYLKRNKCKFDIIFADPPYEYDEYLLLKNSIIGILKPNGQLCFEMQKRNIETDEHTRIKHYGNTQIVFWRKI